MRTVLIPVLISLLTAGKIPSTRILINKKVKEENLSNWIPDPQHYQLAWSLDLFGTTPASFLQEKSVCKVLIR